MTFKTFVMTDEWRTTAIGDQDDTDKQLLRHGITGEATLTPVIPDGLRVDDDPRAWMLLNRVHKCSYHLGRLVGPDGLDGVRLVGWVGDKPVAWRVRRRLRFGGEWLAPLPELVVAPADEVAHLPDIVPVDREDFEKLPRVAVALDGVLREISEVKAGFKEARENTAAAASSAERTEKAAAQIPAFEQAVSTTTSARDQVVELTRRAETAADGAEMHAEEASTSKTNAESARDESRLARDAGAKSRDEAQALAAAAKVDRTAAEEAARNAEATTKREVSAAIAALVGSAPEHLDTLAEIAKAIGSNGDAVAALVQQVSGKADKTHNHEISDVTGLSAALQGKADAAHMHPQSRIEDLPAALDAIRDALDKRARGDFDFVVGTERPGVGTPPNRVTVVTEVLPQ